jgi:XTP/dITP diphosphohydrolase
VKKETGDLMLHMVFYAKLGSELSPEEGGWDIADSLNSICEKLITRHPHIYGDVEANDEETVKANWEKIKLKEGNKSVLEGVPKSLPSLIKAYRVQDKVRGVGFDWDNVGQVLDKVNEELEELSVEVEAGSDRILDEFGDVFFALINYARFLDVNPDEALERTNKRFIERFKHLEESIKNDGKDIGEMPLLEMEEYWGRAKRAKG